MAAAGKAKRLIARVGILRSGDVQASRSIRQAEVGAAKTMIERTEERFGLKPERLVGDTAYGAATAPCVSKSRGFSR
jgi:hypothetical protein